MILRCFWPPPCSWQSPAPDSSWTARAASPGSAASGSHWQPVGMRLPWQWSLFDDTNGTPGVPSKYPPFSSIINFIFQGCIRVWKVQNVFVECMINVQKLLLCIIAYLDIFGSTWNWVNQNGFQQYALSERGTKLFYMILFLADR